VSLPLRPVAAACLVLVLVASCSSKEEASVPPSTEGAATAETAAAAPSTKPRPTYRLLSEGELTGALLGVQDLPAGYSQDAPSADRPNKTFCDYEPPFEEQVKVRQDFTKGGGLSSELLSIGLRQYASAEEARAAFDALADALASCPGETYEGTQLTYSPMSAPTVGDASVGVKINADGTDLLQTFALVGPTLINTAGGGLMNASADDVNSLLEAQVDAYNVAATK
jgi:hypothetical protein